MKHKFSKQFTSILLALVMIIGMIPVSALTVFAAEPIIIHEIKTKMAAERVPRAGMEVSRFIPTVPDGEPYERPWNGSRWHDEQGVIIAPSVNHFYDLGYEFEAGRTYYADYTYWADYSRGFDADRKLIAKEMDSGFFSKVGEEKPDSGNDLMAQLAALVQENPELVKELLAKANTTK